MQLRFKSIGTKAGKSVRWKRWVILVSAIAIFYPRPVRANPATIAIPALCSTGAGCVLAGAVLVGGVLYYTWVSRDTGRAFRVPAIAFPIVDDENPRGWLPGKEVAVYNPEACERIARKYGKQLVEIREDRDWTGKPFWICVYEE